MLFDAEIKRRSAAAASWETLTWARELQPLQQVVVDNEEEDWMDYEGDHRGLRSRRQILQVAHQSSFQVHVNRGLGNRPSPDHRLNDLSQVLPLWRAFE